MNTYDIGDKPTFRGEFRDVYGALTDPDVIYFSYRTPQRVKTTIAYVFGYTGDGGLLRIDTGIYEISLNVQISGVWAYRFWSTGTGQTAGEGQIKVRESYFVDA
jgi:hypothetical protein